MIIYLLFASIPPLFWYAMFFEIPKLPPTVYEYVEQFFGYLEVGAGILANYVHLPYLMTLFTIILAVDGAILIYHLVMWILKKIPVLGIE